MGTESILITIEISSIGVMPTENWDHTLIVSSSACQPLKKNTNFLCVTNMPVPPTHSHLSTLCIHALQVSIQCQYALLQHRNFYNLAVGTRLLYSLVQNWNLHIILFISSATVAFNLISFSFTTCPKPRQKRVVLLSWWHNKS